MLISRQFFVTLLSMVNVTNISEFLTSDHVHFPYPSNTEDELKHIMHPNPEPVAFNPPPVRVSNPEPFSASVHPSPLANLTNPLRSSVPIPPPVDIPPQLPPQLMTQPSLVTTLRTPIVIPFDSVKSHSIIRQLNVPPTVVKTDKLGLSFLSRLFPDSAVGMSMFPVCFYTWRMDCENKHAIHATTPPACPVHSYPDGCSTPASSSPHSSVCRPAYESSPR